MSLLGMLILEVPGSLYHFDPNLRMPVSQGGKNEIYKFSFFCLFSFFEPNGKLPVVEMDRGRACGLKRMDSIIVVSNSDEYSSLYIGYDMMINFDLS